MFASVHAYNYLIRNSKLVCNQIPWEDTEQLLVYISIIPYSSKEQKQFARAKKWIVHFQSSLEWQNENFQITWLVCVGKSKLQKS